MILALLSAVVLGLLLRALPPLVCLRVYLLLLTANAVIALWLPAALQELFALPVLVVVSVACIWHMLRLVQHKPADKSSGGSTIVKPAATAAAFLLLLGVATWTPAQPPLPTRYPVLIVNDAKPAALVAPELLAKLDELENQTIFGPQGALLLNARYAGKVNEGGAAFEAQYDLHRFKEQANLVIPLTGVQLLEGAFLDGAPVYPTVHRNGYALPIRGNGAHHLRLAFSARIASGGDHFELKFTIPKLAQTELALRWPTPTPAVDCLHCSGQEVTSTQEWHAQVGYEGLVHLRWANTAALPALKTIEVKEAHFWDLRPGALALSSSLQYALGKSSLTQLGVAVPDGLHVRAVEAAAMGALPLTPTPTPILIKNWQVLGKGAQRRLLVDFSQPITGNIVLNLEFAVQPAAPTRPMMTLPLRLPTASQGKSKSGLLGYRLDAKETKASPQNLSVQSIQPEDFELGWKKQSIGSSAPAASRAYSFQRPLPQAGAGLILEVQPLARQAQLDVEWRLDMHCAELEAKCLLTSSHEDLSIVTFFIDPALTLSDVTGPEVGRWYLQDSLLQVWLRLPCKQAAVKLTGWRPFDKSTLQQAKKRLALPCVYPLQTQITAASLKLIPARGVRADTDQMRGLRPDPAGPSTWRIDGFPYAASFWLSADNQLLEASLLTKVQSVETGLEIRQGIRITPEPRQTAPRQAARQGLARRRAGDRRAGRDCAIDQGALGERSGVGHQVSARVAAGGLCHPARPGRETETRTARIARCGIGGRSFPTCVDCVEGCGGHRDPDWRQAPQRTARPRQHHPDPQRRLAQ